MHGANTAFLRLNLAPATCSPLLLVVSLLPVPTKLLAELFDSREDKKMAATIYVITLTPPAASRGNPSRRSLKATHPAGVMLAGRRFGDHDHLRLSLGQEGSR